MEAKRAELAVQTESSGVLLTVAYDGTAFSGWAAQPGRRTVQGELLAAIARLDASVLDVRGASRTDAGVHALGQRVAFDPSRTIACRGWVLGLQSHLPRDVSIRRAARVERGFVPRGAAHKKRYVYRVFCDKVRDPLLERTSLRVHTSLDIGAMQREARCLVGTHDFAAFRSSADMREQTRRDVFRADVLHSDVDARLVSIVVEGSGFLHHMMRIIAGTLIDVGCGRLRPGAIERALSSKQRRDLGRTAPAHGLCLEHIWLNVVEQDAWPA